MEKRAKYAIIVLVLIMVLIVAVTILSKSESGPEDPICIQAGKQANYLNPTVEQVECCEGLVEVPGGVEYLPSNGNADENGCVLVFGAATICTDCGNGICEDWENECNCEADCPKN